MTQTAGLDDGIRKLEEFVASMGALREQLAQSPEVESVRSAFAAGEDMVDAQRAWLGEHEREVAADGKLAPAERERLEEARHHAALVDLLGSAEATLGAVQAAAAQAHGSLQAARDELHDAVDQRVGEIAADLEAMLDSLHHATARVEESQQGVCSSVDRLEELLERSGAVLEATIEEMLACCERLLAGDHEAQEELLGALLRQMERHRELQQHAWQAMESLPDAVSAVKVVETVVEVVVIVVVIVVAITVAVCTLGAGSAAAVGAVIVAAELVSTALAATGEAYEALGRVLEAGHHLASSLAPLLPQIEPIRDLVARVNELLDALNPFD